MRNVTTCFTLIGLLTCFSEVHAQDQEYDYAPSFRYCPDRDFDIAWENDLVAFRVYGKQPSENAGLSGVDAWHKRVSYPIVDKWYRGYLEGISYHEDHGEGCDRYHVGKTRGVGGVGLWRDDKIVRSGLYESWEVQSITPSAISFQLTYRWNLEQEKITETRTIKLENGSQLYEATSQFSKNGKPIKGLEIAIGLSTQNGAAEVSMNESEGWMSAWHALGGNQGRIGVGAIADTNYLIRMLEQKSDKKDESHVIAIVKTDAKGNISWKAGFAWEKAGKITTRPDWDAYLSSWDN
ncbi:MAG: DUF4861 family protein [Bacteroidota bacterium]